MGINLRSLAVIEDIELEDLRGNSLAVDSSNILHQFLSTIRTSRGKPLTDENGNVTSHLVGLLFRSTNLIHSYEIPLVFVFDGGAPTLKSEEMKRRRKRRNKAKKEYEEAIESGNFEEAHSKAMQAAGLNKQMFDDAKMLLRYLGIPFVQAPGEAEAQASYMARRGDVWGSNSRDYDNLLFGAPMLVRYLTISANRRPELIELEKTLDSLGINHRQLVDMAILMGTDYNPGIYGVGPKTSLKWIKEYGRIEELPEDKKKQVSPFYERIRNIYLDPDITDVYSTGLTGLKEEELYSFLCAQRGFPRDRVKTAVDRMRDYYENS